MWCIVEETSAFIVFSQPGVFQIIYVSSFATNLKCATYLLVLNSFQPELRQIIETFHRLLEMYQLNAIYC